MERNIECYILVPHLYQVFPNTKEFYKVNRHLKGTISINEDIEEPEVFFFNIGEGVSPMYIDEEVDNFKMEKLGEVDVDFDEVDGDDDNDFISQRNFKKPNQK